MTHQKKRTVFKFLKSAKSGLFVNNTFHGDVELDGSGHKFFSNIFGVSKKKSATYSLLYKITILIVIIGIVLALGFRFSGIQIGPFSFSPPVQQNTQSLSLISNEAKLIADTIIISGWEDYGDYLGYLSQITSFYQKHQDIYPMEFATYNRQLTEWQDKFKNMNDKGSAIYNSDFDQMSGLVESAKEQLREISIQSDILK